MPKSAEVTYQPLAGREFQCEVRSPAGLTMRCSGAVGDLEPRVLGDDELGTNPALVHNAWSFGKHEWIQRQLSDGEEREGERKQADAYRKVAGDIATLVDRLGRETRHGWCSGCFARSDHRKLSVPFGSFTAYLCERCGAPSIGCAGPGCANMAVARCGSMQMPRYCAEHRHEIPSFDKATTSFGNLENYSSFLTFEKRNLARGSRVTLFTVLTAAALVPGAVAAAPAIGGAVASLTGSTLTGAALSSSGLATLGFGSVAAGGFGMAGGTYVVAAAGAALGGALGSSVTSAYIGADKSFRIEKLKSGTGIPVIVANGFTTEGMDTRRDWEDLVERRYPDSPIYRVHWGAKDLEALGTFVGAAGAKQVAAAGIKGAAAKATKMGAKKFVGPVAPALLVAGMAKNPWHTAKVKADRAGVALAGLLARTDAKSYMLIGHSLGARVAATAAETLATAKSGPKIEAVHLLGAAIGAKGDWRLLNKAVVDSVHNYHSVNDNILKYLYKAAQGGKTAAGHKGFGSELPKIHDHDVSAIVDGHSAYLKNVVLT